MKTTEQIIREIDEKGAFEIICISSPKDASVRINTDLSYWNEYAKLEWVLLKELKELIRRNKMDEDELKWNKTHSDWNKALIMIENAITSTSHNTD